MSFQGCTTDIFLMSENLKKSWESFSNGERIELGLIQVDIEGHSRIEASESTLKAVRDVLYEAIKGTAFAKGGRLFGWAGDGGIFMFLTGDGEGFNTLVNVALEMLNNMSAINKKIADKTDLKTPIHVRISCDSGTVAFDQDPTRITADFINSFTKNERSISLVDTICITERVFRQLHSRLRDRFRLYKHSSEVRSDIYCLLSSNTRGSIDSVGQEKGIDLPGKTGVLSTLESLLRWKQFVLTLLVGMILGLICAAILAHFGWLFSFSPAKSASADQNTVYMLGSGTVFRYLGMANLFKDFKESRKDVQVLEGPTATGARLFAGTTENQKNRVLVMAAGRPDLNKLRQYDKQPGLIYEVYLGADAFQVLFATRGARRVQPSTSDRYFWDTHRLTFANLREAWKRDKYDIYTGDPDSGTRILWERHLFGNGKLDYPSEPKTWDIRIAQIFLHWTPDSLPRIHLGSEVLSRDQETIMEGNLGSTELFHNILTIVDEHGADVKRGLFLYGWLEETPNVARGEGYFLPKPVVEVLKSLFSFLKGQQQKLGPKRYLEPECLEEQMKYFHLKPYDDERGEGWISVGGRPTDSPFFRPETCKQRVDN